MGKKGVRAGAIHPRVDPQSDSPHSGPYTEGGSKAGEALYEEIEQVLRTCPSANRTRPRRLEQSVLSDRLRLCGSGTLEAETMA